jgi:hypothetical protein
LLARVPLGSHPSLRSRTAALRTLRVPLRRETRIAIYVGFIRLHRAHPQGSLFGSEPGKYFRSLRVLGIRHEKIRKEIASALGIIVYPLVDTPAWPASERRKLAAIGKSIMTAEDELEALVGTYRKTCGLARQESGFTKGSIIAALRNLLRSQERLRSAQGRRGLEGESRRAAAASAYKEALLRISDSRSGLDNETTKQLEKLATRCLAPLRLHPHRVPEAALELAPAVASYLGKKTGIYSSRYSDSFS